MMTDSVARAMAMDAAKNGGIPFTQEEKDKLASITNPIIFKGRVDEYSELPSEPKTGWMYLVGAADAPDCAEYVFTDSGKWEYIGSSNVDMTDCIKKTDIPSSTTTAGVRINTNYGIGVNPEYGTLYIVPASEAEINEQSNNRKPIVPERISYMMSCYGITSKEQIPDMQSEISAMNSSGHKNLLRLDHIPERMTVNGVTIENPGDGTLILSGKLNSSSPQILIFNINKGVYGQSIQTDQVSGRSLDGIGAYISDTGTDNANVRLQVYGNNEVDTNVVMLNPNWNKTSPVSFDYTTEYVYTWFRLYVSGGADFTTPVTIRPMICRKEIYDIDPSFKKYAETSASDMADRISTIEKLLTSAGIVSSLETFGEEESNAEAYPEITADFIKVDGC